MAERVISDAGAEALEMIPHFLRDAPQAQGLLDALAREVQRVFDLIEEVRTQWFPQLITDGTYLAMWEFNLGLPIATPGQTVEQRAANIAVRMGKRSSASGADWIDALNAVIGFGSWAYKEDSADYTVRITLPYGSGTLTALTALALARDVTPAHLAITVQYDGGGGGGTFIAGVSLIGVGQL